MQENDPFPSIDRDDIEDWAGSRIFNRGKSYFQKGAVKDVKRLETDAIIAQVDGTSSYITVVTVNDDEIGSECSCPYQFDCKHGVAALLQFLQLLKDGKEIEYIDDISKENWLRKLKTTNAVFFPEVPTDAEPKESLKHFLEKRKKSELIDLLSDMAEQNDHLRSKILNRFSSVNKDPNEILQEALRLLNAIQDIEYDYHYDYPHIDTEHNDLLFDQIKALKEKQAYDQLINLGTEVLQAGAKVIEHEPESESFPLFKSCIETIVDALPFSTLKIPDKLLWAIDMDMEDGYGLCYSINAEFLNNFANKTAWSKVADQLSKRLKEMKPASKSRFYESDYNREQMTSWIKIALSFSGRNHEIKAFFENEAHLTKSYEPLVSYLIEIENWEEAKHACIKGLKIEHNKTHSMEEYRLYEHLKNIYLQTQQIDAVASLEADAFFDSPSSDSYFQLIELTKQLGIAIPIKDFILQFLKDGVNPVNKSAQTKNNNPWPLPPLEAPSKIKNNLKIEPNYEVLIDISIEENNPTEVLKWYKIFASKKARFYSDHKLQQVASCLKNEYPEWSIAIWKRLAEHHISTVTPSGYQAAKPYLKKIKKLMLKNENEQEWVNYHALLSEQNKRRPRCMQILKSL